MDLKDIESYPYPDSDYERVEVTVPTSGIWRGDVINCRKVGSVKSGTKWATVMETGGSVIARLPVGTEVKVLRERETDESRKRFRRVEANRRLAEQLQDYGKGFEKARERLEKKLAEYHFADYNTLADLMEEQAERKIWAEFDAAVDFFQEKDDFDGDLVSIFEEFRDDIRERLMSPHLNRSLSRSTNVMSNLFEDVDREAWAKFLQSLKYYL